MNLSAAPIVWAPQDADRAGARVTHFLAWLRDRAGRSFADYEELRSVDDLPAFWAAVWEYFDVAASELQY